MNINRRITQLEQSAARQTIPSGNAAEIAVKLAVDPVAANLMGRLKDRCRFLDAPSGGRPLRDAIFADAEARGLARDLSRQLSTRKAGAA